jgi:hypothetical protein
MAHGMANDEELPGYQILIVARFPFQLESWRCFHDAMMSLTSKVRDPEVALELRSCKASTYQGNGR